MLKSIIVIGICIVLTGCAGPHSLWFTKETDKMVVSTDPKDKNIFGKQKPLPKAVYKVKPTEQGLECEADFKNEFKMIEVVANKNQT